MNDYQMPDEDKELLAASMATLSEHVEEFESMIDEVVELGPDGADADCHISGEIALALYNIVSILTDAVVDCGAIDEEEIEQMMNDYLAGPTLH